MPVWSLELLHFATRREASLRTKTNPRRIERPRNSRETEPEPWSDHTWSLYNHWTSSVKWHISCLNWVFCYLQPKWASGFSINLFCAMIGNKAASQQNGFKMLPNINSCIIQILIARINNQWRSEFPHIDRKTVPSREVAFVILPDE